MSWDRLGSSYDRVADRYEARFADELEDKAADRHLLETFAAAAGDPVADVGCGPGQIGAYLRQRGRIVLGVDLSFEMAKLAGRRLCAPVTLGAGFEITRVERRDPHPSDDLRTIRLYVEAIHRA